MIHSYHRATEFLLEVIILAALLACSNFSFASSSNPYVDLDIGLLQKILSQRQDPDLYYRLGDLYLQKGRQTGDITYFQLAENALRRSIELEPKLEQAHRHLAFVFYSLHEFGGAKSEAQRAIQLDPLDSYAYGVLGDAQLETGDYDAAGKSYGRMTALKDDLYSYSRRSGLETIRGENGAGVADLRRAIADGLRMGEPPEGIAWAQVILAQDYFLMGAFDAASEQGAAALRTYPAYYRALAILGQVRGAQGKLDEAADFYRRAIAVIPLPEYVAALSDIYTKMDRYREALQARQLIEFIAHLNAVNRVLYNRVLVEYYADHDIEHQHAVELATAEFQIRQEIYGQDALAWALYRDHKPCAALPHIAAAVRFRTTDARLYFHAGMIYAALGRDHQARASLKRALAINPHFQPLLDDIAAHEYATLRPMQNAQTNVNPCH